MQGMARIVWLPIGLLLTVAGCATRVAQPPRTVAGEVGVAIVPPAPGTRRMALPPNQAFVYPNLIEPVAMPAYPPALLPQRLSPHEVCVDVHIDAAGAVAAAQPREDAACATADVSPRAAAFVDAALEAVRQWRYDPAYLCIAPEGSQGYACGHPEAIERPTAVRLSYVFRFTQRDGAPKVERIAAPGGG